MVQSEVPAGIVKLAHALVEDEKLRKWFYALKKLPKRVRKEFFGDMARQTPRVYETVLAAVRERVGEKAATD